MVIYNCQGKGKKKLSKNFEKNLKKGIDKLEKVCYNINVIRKGKTGTSQNKSKKGHDQREKVGKL